MCDLLYQFYVLSLNTPLTLALILQGLIATDKIKTNAKNGIRFY